MPVAIVMGTPRAGKTTVAAHIAERQKYFHVDPGQMPSPENDRYEHLEKSIADAMRSGGVRGEKNNASITLHGALLEKAHPVKCICRRLAPSSMADVRAMFLDAADATDVDHLRRTAAREALNALVAANHNGAARLLCDVVESIVDFRAGAAVLAWGVQTLNQGVLEGEYVPAPEDPRCARGCSKRRHCCVSSAASRGR